MSDERKAVFLSYASQDAEAAKRICDALRAAGVEVWFDQSELRGGDSWDAKIRKQIKECALFVPVISAATQSRSEGYFRLEWKLAVDRSHLMAEDTHFLFPVVIDDTPDATARVPEKFREVQWTRLNVKDTPETLARRIEKMLGGPVDPERSVSTERAGRTAKKKPARPAWLRYAWVGVGLLFTVIYAGRPLWQPAPRPDPKQLAPAAPVAGAAELARVRAALVPDRWQREDFATVSATLDRLIQENPESADAWAMRSIINSLQVLRNFDSSTRPLEAGKMAADRALRLNPDSPLGELAFGMHLVAMMSRGGDAQVCRSHIERGLAGITPDPLTRYAELVSRWFAFDFVEVNRIAEAWLKAEPSSSFPAWIYAQSYLVRRQPAEAARWADQASADPNITGVRALYTLFESHYYLNADVAAARAGLDRISPTGRSVHRVVHARWLLDVAEHKWDAALQELAQVPENFLFDRTYHGPKSLLAGLAHRGAGRPEAAQAQFREAERLLREHLAQDADNEELHAVLAFTLACAGRAAEAHGELALVEPLLKGRPPTLYRGPLVVPIAQAYSELGDFANLAFWLRKLFSEPSQFPFTPASVRIDPRFASATEAPEIQALLREFASLDQPATPAPSSLSLPPSGPPTADQKSVAVLAFANLSDDKNNEYFSDGISEELLNVLAKVPGLKVSARTSAFYFKGKEVPVPEIAKQLGVAYVVEGSVRKQGDKVRITAQLIKAADGFHVWSDTFTRDLKDIFAVQDEIAGLIAQNLKLGMGLAVPAVRRAVNPEAHRLLLEGRYFWNLRTREGFDRAEAAFTKAIELDPQFAQAYAGLADVRWVRTVYASYSGDNFVLTVDPVAASERAQALDPTLAEAYPAVGAKLQWTGRTGEAGQQFKKAIALNPNYALAHHWYSLVLEGQGRLDEALAEIDQAIQLDPLSVAALSTRLRFLLMAGRVPEALTVVEKMQALRPAFFLYIGVRAQALLAAGRRDEALAAARSIVASPDREVRYVSDALAVYVLRMLGHEAEAVAHVDNLLPRLPADSYLRGVVLAALDRWDEAMPYLERTPPGMCEIFFWNPMWDRWREDPRFTRLLEKLGCIEEYKVARATQARMLKEQEAKK